MSSKRHATLCPRSKVVGRCHSAADALLLSNRPILLEGLRAIDRGSVRTSAGVDIVGTAVGLDRAFELAAAGGIICAEVFAIDVSALSERQPW